MGDDKKSEQITTFKGKAVKVTFHKTQCIGMSECGRADGELFIGERDPWCDPDTSSAQIVKEVIERCPSGALSCEVNGKNVEQSGLENTVQVSYNGPLLIKGDLDLEGNYDRSPGNKYRAALCRCGLSKNKPFCDNSHVGSEFRDSGAVGRVGGDVIEGSGPLTITPQKNASLTLKGNFTLRSSSGRDAWKGSKAALCRCGASQSKPFCDGSHKKINFIAD